VKNVIKKLHVKFIETEIKEKLNWWI
jgi:hypothetical protein